MAESSTTTTRVKLLDAAERLFAQTGIGGTSLRAITSEANTNLASIHYHFGGKEALLQAVFARRIEPVNKERIELLDKTESTSVDPELEDIIRAFVKPALGLLKSLDHGGANVMQLMGRLYSEPGEFKFAVLHLFEEVAERFSAALNRAVPALPPDELFWRFHFMIGSMAFTLVAGDIIEHRSEGHISLDDVDANVERLVSFAAGGLRAPLPNFEHAKGPTQ
jgi:AcrR family transcriptional regulator